MHAAYLPYALILVFTMHLSFSVLITRLALMGADWTVFPSLAIPVILLCVSWRIVSHVNRDDVWFMALGSCLATGASCAVLLQDKHTQYMGVGILLFAMCAIGAAGGSISAFQKSKRRRALVTGVPDAYPQEDGAEEGLDMVASEATVGQHPGKESQAKPITKSESLDNPKPAEGTPPKPYWETETPVTIETSSNVLRWYPVVSKLQIARPDWKDKDGSINPGKTVTLDISSLPKESSQIFLEILTRILK